MNLSVLHLSSMFFYVSLQSFRTCIWSVKEKSLSFVSYCILYLDRFLITRALFCLIKNNSLPDPFLPDHYLRNTHSPIDCSHPPGTWYYDVQLSPWSLDHSHQPCFGQTPQLLAPFHPPSPWYSSSTIKTLTLYLLFVFFVKQNLSCIFCGTYI